MKLVLLLVTCCFAQLSLRMAVYQGSSTAANINTIDSVCAQAQSLGVKLIVFPELFFQGYSDKKTYRDLAESVNGANFKSISDIAKKYSISICLGVATIQENKLYNTAWLFDDQGALRAQYNKMNLVGFETSVFTKGTEFPKAINLFGVNITMAIGSDLQYPEMFRLIQRYYTNVAIIPGAQAFNADEMNPFSELYVPVRAKEFGYHVAYANYYQLDDATFKFNGKSAIATPNGTFVRIGPNNAISLINADLNIPPGVYPDTNALSLLTTFCSQVQGYVDPNFGITIVSGVMLVLSIVIFLVSIAICIFAGVYAHKQAKAGRRGTDDANYTAFVQ